jgi:hypothetical protein
LVGRETDAATIEDAIHRNGLRLRVRAVPAGPSFVGHFLTFASAAPPPELHLLGSADEVSYIGFSVPERWAQAVTLYVGRPARGNEVYRVAGSAFAPGEPLECSGLFHARARTAATELADRELTVRWQVVAGITSRDVTIDEVRSGEVGRYLLADARSVARGEIRVLLSPDGTVPFLVQPTPPAPC